MSENRQTEIMEEVYQDAIKANTVISEFGNEIVKGNAFKSHILLSLTAGQVVDLGLLTPSDKDIRWFPVLLSSDVNYVKGQVYADSAFTGDVVSAGTNYNQQSTKTTGLIFYDNLSITTLGNEIDLLATLGSTLTPFRSSGSTQEGEAFFTFKRSTQHILRLTNTAAITCTALITNAWLETDLTD